VVFHHIRRHVCVWYDQYQSLADSDASIGTSIGFDHLLRLLHSYRDDPGYYKSASRSHQADLLIRASWPPNCYNDVQDMGLHHNGAGIAIHFGLQARSLHEDFPASDILVPVRGNFHRWYCAACRPDFLCLAILVSGNGIIIR